MFSRPSGSNYFAFNSSTVKPSWHHNTIHLFKLMPNWSVRIILLFF